ncbi:MAG: hypothetical protein JO147_06480 [Actinobacteria bacterium]|nr:hypothetical protein [Actinomycetota bacterium]
MRVPARSYFQARSTSARGVLAVIGLAVGALASACTSSTLGAGHPGFATPRAGTSTPSGVTRPSGSVSSSGSAGTVATKPVRTVAVDKTASGMKYTVTVWVEDRQADCAAHAYGAAVTTYLQAHPCESMSRALATTTVGGHPVELARESIGFAGQAPAVYQVATDFQALEEKDGTGSLADLLREGHSFTGSSARIPNTDAFDAEAQDSGVTIVDSWYLDGPTPANTAALVAMAKDLFLQF